MEYLSATRNYIVLNLKGSTFEEFSKEVEKFDITQKDLMSNMWLCIGAPHNDYIVIPTDNFNEWQFMDEERFKSAFTVINSTEWRGY